jgi:predicted nucleotidyltransferase
MLQITEKLLQELTDILVREAKPRKIILFGSQARGTARADSDLDFLIVKDGPFDAQRSRRGGNDPLKKYSR